MDLFATLVSLASPGLLEQKGEEGEEEEEEEEEEERECWEEGEIQAGCQVGKKYKALERSSEHSGGILSSIIQ